MDKQKKIKRVMEGFKNGTLKTSDGKVVKNRKQALAIAMSESEDYSEKSDIMSSISISSVAEAEEILKAAGTEDLFEKAKLGDEREYQGRMYVYGTTKSGKMGWKVKDKVKRGSGASSAATGGSSLGGSNKSAPSDSTKTATSTKKNIRQKTNSVVHDINGTEVIVSKNSDGSYTLEANGKKVRSDNPSFYVNGTDIKPKVKKALAKELGLDTAVTKKKLRPIGTGTLDSERRTSTNNSDKKNDLTENDEELIDLAASTTYRSSIREYIKQADTDKAKKILQGMLNADVEWED